MIDYKITLDNFDDNFIYLIFELSILGYRLKQTKIALIKSAPKSSWNEKIDFATFIAQRIFDNIERGNE